MSYVENCSKHGQYKGDYCGDCIDETQNLIDKLSDENTHLILKNNLLKKTLDHFANKVDEALLLDEDLDQAWGELRQIVIEVRSVLEGK
jgi:hypothetical protein